MVCLDPDIRSGLAEAAAELTVNLTGIFEDEWARRREKADIEGSPGAVITRMIPRSGRVLGIDITAEPRAGLMVRVTHWSVPDGKTLTIFAPAFAENDDEVGVLDSDPDDPGVRSFLPTIYIEENLATCGFRHRWFPGADGNLQVSLYPAT
jgi:hypothetical protein